MKTLALGLLLLGLVGCGAMGLPTDQAPTWVQMMDRLTKVEAKQAAPGAPIVVTKGDAPSDPTGGAVPGAGMAIAALALLWYKMRSSAAASRTTAELLAGSVPRELHERAVNALAVSSPFVPITERVPEKG